MKKLACFLFSILFLITACTSTKQIDPNQGHPYYWKKGDTLESVGKKYQVDPTKIRKHNEIYDPNDLTAGMKIYIPGGVPPKGEPQTPTTPVKSTGDIKFGWPSEGTISSGYGSRHGKMHHGIDITKDGGLSIKAAADGVVDFSGTQRGYGKTIIIDHGGGYTTLYAHNAAIYVQKGSKVKRGKIISKMGASGKVTGIHLHFEIRLNEKSQNPLRYLPVR